MGDQRRRKRKQQDLHSSSPSPSPSLSPSSSSPSSDHSDHVSRHHYRKRSRSSSRPRREKKERRRRRSERSDSDRKHHRRKSRHRDRKVRVSEESSSGDDNSGRERPRYHPQTIIRHVLNQFPGVGADLLQLLQMVDDGQAIDISELSERSLVKSLKKLFMSLRLKESGRKVFLLPSNVNPTLEVVGSILRSRLDLKQGVDSPVSGNDAHSTQPDVPCELTLDNTAAATPCADGTAPIPTPPTKRVIGPEMPSAELLAAAAKLTEAEAKLREAEVVVEDTDIFIGPPPPAVVAEAESANEAERFEEVTRIMGAEAGSPYDALGVNHNMSPDNIKKRYWKLSLMVHPDKCPHPQAHEAFIILNKAFKDLQDPDKRQELDEKIKLKEEQEKFKIELKAMREAAQWRRSQGISMEGDDELLADMDVKAPPKREEWMTTLPPERKPGVTMQSTRFSKNTKEGRGDTSAWTDTPSDRAQKAKMNYLEAYNEAAALASNEENKKTCLDADLVDKYNKTSRSKSLVQKHQEETRSRSKRKKSKQLPSEKAEWEGNHPWKPWDREKDLTAGRQSVNLEPENMTQGLTSRFSSGNFQRNFL